MVNFVYNINKFKELWTRNEDSALSENFGAGSSFDRRFIWVQDAHRSPYRRLLEIARVTAEDRGLGPYKRFSV
jgi:hypothetical protein